MEELSISFSKRQLAFEEKQPNSDLSPRLAEKVARPNDKVVEEEKVPKDRDDTALTQAGGSASEVEPDSRCQSDATPSDKPKKLKVTPQTTPRVLPSSLADEPALNPTYKNTTLCEMIPAQPGPSFISTPRRINTALKDIAVSPINVAKQSSKKNQNNKQNLESLTCKDLRGMCAARGLIKSGVKAELISRLRNPVGHIATKQHLSTKDVDSLLAAAGVADPKQVSKCLKRGIQKKYISFDSENPLKEVVISSSCFECDEDVTVTVEDLLYQPDYAGCDYEMGGEEATVRCSNEECSGLYVTRICEGCPEFDSGKFHNHCTECKGFGQCIGDYREAHCKRCGGHYFAGCQGFPCPCREGREGRGGRGNDCIVA